ncbi:MAG: hypothetical protein NVS3B25_05760 [Hymenobacter sp.]
MPWRLPARLLATQGIPPFYWRISLKKQAIGANVLFAIGFGNHPIAGENGDSPPGRGQIGTWRAGQQAAAAVLAGLLAGQPDNNAPRKPLERGN